MILRTATFLCGHWIADTWDSRDTPSHNVGYLRSAGHHRVYKWRTHNLRFSDRRLEQAEAAGTLQLCSASSVPGPRYLRWRDDDNLGPTFLSTWVSPAAELSRAEIDGGWRVESQLGARGGSVWMWTSGDNNKTQWRQGTSPARDTAPSYRDISKLPTMQTAAILLATLAVILQTMQTAHSQPVRDVSEQWFISMSFASIVILLT